MAKQKKIVTKHARASGLVDSLMHVIPLSVSNEVGSNVSDFIYSLIYDNKAARKRLQDLLDSENPINTAMEFREKKERKHAKRIAKLAKRQPSELETAA